MSVAWSIWSEAGNHRANAIAGSRRLRRAIERACKPAQPRVDRPRAVDRSIAAIQDAVATRYNITVDDLVSTSRQHRYVRPRQIAMYLAVGGASYPKVGRAFHRDHTTVIHAIKAVETRMKDDIDLVRDIAVIRGSLEG